MRIRLKSFVSCHPATAVLLWLFFVVWMMDKPPVILLVINVLLMLGTNRPVINLFLRYLRRSRWLLLVLLLVHAYSLPGAPLISQLALYSPSVVGVQSGLLQMWRLILVLALLAILMARLSRESLLLGLYSIMRYVCFWGCSAKRIATRIALTLSYADALMNEPHKISFQQRLQQLSQPAQVEPVSNMTLEQRSFIWLDYASLCSMIALFWWMP
jgi:energy-coupling factor transporter transmembrane protein EcfT